MTRMRFRAGLQVVLAVAMARGRTLSRYPGALLLEAVMPLVIALVPLALGRAVAGSQASAAFAQNTGASSAAGFMLLGSTQFVILGGAIWNLGHWMRREAQGGTLEALYTCPAPRGLLLAGIALFGIMRDILVFLVVLLAGRLVFGIDWLGWQVVRALLLVVLGAVPLYGLSLVYAGFILRVKEAASVAQLVQWLLGMVIGIFTPIHMYPRALRWISLSFPTTWVTNGLRAVLLDARWYLDIWYRDVMVLGVFALTAPVVGAFIFRRAEKRLRASSGMGWG